LRDALRVIPDALLTTPECVEGLSPDAYADIWTRASILSLFAIEKVPMLNLHEVL
jgi:hypothetical protein